MASHLWEGLSVTSNHRFPARAFRPEPGEYADVQEIVKAHGIDAYLRACLRWIRDRPDEALTILEPYRPEAKPRGRPWPSRSTDS
jgi:hypothetical protein